VPLHLREVEGCDRGVRVVDKRRRKRMSRRKGTILERSDFEKGHGRGRGDDGKEEADGPSTRLGGGGHSDEKRK